MSAKRIANNPRAVVGLEVPLCHVSGETSWTSGLDSHLGVDTADVVRPPLTANELLDHPEFEGLFWDLKPAKKGKVTVAQGRRGGAIKLSYELHGEGAIKLVVNSKTFLCDIPRAQDEHTWVFQPSNW